MKKILGLLSLLLLFTSCASHKRSNISANEEFVVELKSNTNRSRGVVDIALQGLFFGANYFAEKSAKSLTNSYSHSISINDYYNTDLGKVEKTYNEIHIKKYSKPVNSEIKENLKQEITNDMSSTSQNSTTSRGTLKTLALKDVVRDEKEDFLNFYAIIELQSDENNPGVTRLSFNELKVFFSKTKVYQDEDLNAKVSISIEGQWRSTDGSPMKATLIEQEFDIKKIKYGNENQIKEPLLSPWYYDIPILSEIKNNPEYGVLKVNVQVQEYEGSKSKYINKLPGLLSDNKNKIIKDGASTIEKMMK